jgi:3-oxoisoapionate decarboxylase
MMRLGINTYTYRWSIGFAGAAPEQPLSATGLLDKARELGVRGIQFGPNLPLDALRDANLEPVVQTAKDNGIELEVATPGLEYEHLARQVALAKRLESTLVRTIPEIGGRPAGAMEIGVLLRAILPVLEREGVRLALENGRIPARELAAVVEDARSLSARLHQRLNCARVVRNGDRMNG